MSEPTWPVQGDPGQSTPCRCSDADARRAYDAYARRYGTSQSMDRLMQRGGFSRNEMDALAPGWVPIEVSP